MLPLPSLLLLRRYIRKRLAASSVSQLIFLKTLASCLKYFELNTMQTFVALKWYDEPN